jgi:hypothetical protein
MTLQSANDVRSICVQKVCAVWSFEGKGRPLVWSFVAISITNLQRRNYVAPNESCATTPHLLPLPLRRHHKVLRAFVQRQLLCSLNDVLCFRRVILFPCTFKSSPCVALSFDFFHQDESRFTHRKFSGANSERTNTITTQTLKCFISTNL